MQSITWRSVCRFAADKQKFMFLFGAPGVGKGTYAKILSKDLSFNHVSTGDEIRKILKGNAPSTFDKSLTAKIKEIVNSGGLVDDSIVVGIIKEKLKEPESKNGVILDGFPRTKGQLSKYDELLPTHLVVNLTLRDDILLEKLMGRRSCSKCSGSFNICDIQRYPQQSM
jgi:adenylate kinase